VGKGGYGKCYEGGPGQALNLYCTRDKSGPVDTWHSLTPMVTLLSFPSYPVTSFESVLEHAFGILDVGCCDSKLLLLYIEAEFFDQRHHFVVCQLYCSWICNSCEICQCDSHRGRLPISPFPLLLSETGSEAESFSRPCCPGALFSKCHSSGPTFTNSPPGRKQFLIAST
jgi:hypothetical protein